MAAPLMVIHGDADPLVNIPAVADACSKRSPERVTQHDIWPGVPHVMALAHDPEKFRQKLHDFLKAAGV
ncbi:MAG: hypothetical protein QM754_04075 [Tepidisphaeraceae bacterium]